ncbi:MAG: ATPase domain-containing protein [Bacillota bacterium]
MDKGKVTQLMDEIDNEFGKGSIYFLGEDGGREIERVETGIEQIDFLMGGGIPVGRIIELYGVESAGKTTIAHQWESLYDYALHIDMEGSFSADRAKQFGNKEGQLIVRKPDYGEEAIDTIIKACEAGMPLIVVDSVPALVPKENINEKDRSKANFAGVARLLSRWMFKIAREAEKNGTTVVFINQVRDNIGSGFAPYTTPGGHALKHYSSLRIRVARKKWLRMSGDVEGQLINLRSYKSKVCPPYREAEISLIFDRGFVNPSEDRKVMREIRKIRREKEDD